ncbi:MAG: hypothetical protein Q8R92_21020 [Deltaproteobacteria bacterium]|nr:hypothetical protein [Deltaproteobacteria bacterium]
MTTAEELPRGVLSVLREVDGDRSEFDEDEGVVWACDARAIIYRGIAAITAAVQSHGIGAYSQRTVRRMLRRREIPARKLQNMWTTTSELLEGLRDTMTRAHAAGMCTCVWCPQHGKKWQADRLAAHGR